MAIYEFRCEQCKQLFEKQLPMTSNVKAIPCPACAARADDTSYNEWTHIPSAHRIISKTSFILKGGGWSTQYRENITAGQEDK